MRILKQILNFYINSSIHVALAVFSLSWLTLIEFNIYYDSNILYFIFFASITGYNFVKFFGIAKFHHRSLTAWLKLIQVFSLFCFLFMCFYLMKIENSIWLYILVFGIITFLYAIPFLPTRKFLDQHHNLRNISGLKVFLIALVWCGVTVYLPLLNNHHIINLDVVIVSLQRFLLVIMLILPFEIRDLQFDSLKLSTIPQKLGVKGTKIMGVILGLIIFCLEFFKSEIALNQLIILLMISTITLVFVILSKEKQGKYYCAFWVEGVPILWLLFVLIFT
ncbi:MAG: hypothetical protein K9I95_13225 [Flavobacteriaceae bacterium]|nr:hypothetical protein [Flavobacteriaceae bacterium]